MKSFDLELGPFRLDHVVGQGGIGLVLGGAHTEERVPVAIKVLTASSARRSAFHTLFQREIQALARLDHPSIAAVLDAGEVPRTCSLGDLGVLPAGSPWLAMPFVPGTPLHEPPVLTWSTVRSAYLKLLDALAHAHALGVVHRDLKPSNVLVEWAEPAPRVTLVDFGIALAQGEVELDSDKTYGTPRFMAPEQVTGRWRDHGPWTDLYAFGCMVWATLCGRPPFDAASVYDILAAQVGAPLPPFEPRLRVPDGVERWLQRLLRKAPSARIQRAADAAYELLGLRGDGDEGDASSGGVVGEALPGSRTALIDILADTLATDAAVVTRNVKCSVPEPAETADVEVSAGVRPPIPHSPPADHEMAVPKQLLGAGLGLFGRRTLPVVDRDAARGQLWDALRGVGRTGRPQVVVLEGPPGYGKSRLASWLVERSHEAGATIPLEIRHSRTPSAQDGVGAMLGRAFCCVGLDHEATVSRLSEVCARLGYSAAERESDAVGLANTMCAPTGDNTMSGGFMGTRERFVALRRLLTRMSRERVVLLWVDDLQWGHDAAAFIRFLLEEVTDDWAAVLVVATLLTQSGDGVAPEAEAIRQLPDTRIIAVGPLAEPDQRSLSRRLLRLEEQVVDVVVRRTEGNPLFAVQLVGHWVKHRFLGLGEDGFVPVEGRVLDVPDDVHALWYQRIQGALRTIPKARRPEALLGFEVGAALGREVDAAEWNLACVLAGVSDPIAVHALLVREQLALMTQTGWAFAHGMLWESVLEGANNAGRLHRIHGACAEALAREPAPSRSQLRRRAEHLVLAGQVDAGVALLLQVAQHAHFASEHAEALEAVVRLRGAMGDASVPEQDPRWADAAWLEARQLHALGRFEALEQLLARALPAARHHRHDTALGRLLVTHGRFLRETGRLADAMGANTEAIGLFERVGLEVGVAEACGGLAGDHLKAGDLMAARQWMERARVKFIAGGMEVEAARAASNIAYTHIAEGNHQDALPWLRSALDVATRHVNHAQIAGCENYLGEVERLAGRWESARAHYERAAEQWALIGHRDELVAALNMALTALNADGFSDAERLLQRVEHDPRMRRDGLMWLVTSMARLVCLSARRDWIEWDSTLQFVKTRLVANPVVELDLAACATRAVELTVACGERERAVSLAEIALHQWVSLGQEPQVHHLDVLLGG